MSFFAVNLKKIRKGKHLSQSEFALIFGMTRATVGAYEEGRAEPKIDTLIEIANYFGLTVDELVRKELSHSKLSDNRQIAGEVLNAIPFVPLSEKKSFIKSMVEQKVCDYQVLDIPNIVADIALEVEEFAGLHSVIVFGREVPSTERLKWVIGLTANDYRIFFAKENFSGLIKFWNVCCLLTKNIDTLFHTDVRIERIETKIDYLLNLAKN